MKVTSSLHDFAQCSPSLTSFYHHNIGTIINGMVVRRKNNPNKSMASALFLIRGNCLWTQITLFWGNRMSSSAVDNFVIEDSDLPMAQNVKILLCPLYDSARYISDCSLISSWKERCHWVYNPAVATCGDCNSNHLLTTCNAKGICLKHLLCDFVSPHNDTEIDTISC
jgi:hypothetical protein